MEFVPGTVKPNCLFPVVVAEDLIFIRLFAVPAREIFWKEDVAAAGKTMVEEETPPTVKVPVEDAMFVKITDGEFVASPPPKLFKTVR